MKLLTRYVVREHVGPLLFALSALTSLLMLQYVARQLANLAGKGLPWSAIAQFFVLSLPFTVAMTMPMAVLVTSALASPLMHVSGPGRWWVVLAGTVALVAAAAILWWLFERRTDAIRGTLQRLRPFAR